MPILTEADIIKVAALAKLELPKDQIQNKLTQFNGIFKHIDKLGELKDLPPLPQPAQTLRMNPDTTHTSLTIEETMQNSKDAQGGFFFIPKVIEGGKV